MAKPPHAFLTLSRAGFKPFMEYAGSYALFNYRLEDPKKGLEYDNLRLIRAFEHGLDPKSSEAGFVLVHVDSMCSTSVGPLITESNNSKWYRTRVLLSMVLSLHSTHVTPMIEKLSTQV